MALNLSKDINVKGAYLLARCFINALPSPDTPATIVNVITGSWLVIPPMSGYLISKLAEFQLTTYLAASYPSINSVAMLPGLVKTDMYMEAFSRFNMDPPELPGSVAVWLSTDKARFLSGRFISVNWDVEDLAARKEEILKDNLLTLQLNATLGKEQFQ
jgi:NAD(P)-dependent dehydrogenase (short-subunit alcohol dehydrogenase family)